MRCIACRRRGKSRHRAFFQAGSLSLRLKLAPRFIIELSTLKDHAPYRKNLSGTVMGVTAVEANAHQLTTRGVQKPFCKATADAEPVERPSGRRATPKCATEGDHNASEAGDV